MKKGVPSGPSTQASSALKPSEGSVPGMARERELLMVVVVVVVARL